jgi:hypothetical protein
MAGVAGTTATVRVSLDPAALVTWPFSDNPFTSYGTWALICGGRDKGQEAP